MKIDRFRVLVVTRVLLLGASIFLLFYFLPKPQFVLSKVILGLVIAYQTYGLIHFVEKTNRELNRFFDSIQNNDFTQSFSGDNLGDSYSNLRKSFERVTKKFLKLRSEKEEQFHYLQTVVQHVGVGLISYKSDGSVELINKAAKQLFDIQNLKNIKALEPFSRRMADTLLNLKSGENASLKVVLNEKTVYLSIQAIQFKIKGEMYTLISLQDIHAEIEREHMAKELEIAWSVQKSLLPAGNPDIPGLDIAGRCLPAKEVGGDYYDFIPMGDNKLAMIIGDVSGKGIPASFYMTLTKGFIQSHMTGDASPKEVLVKVNELMYHTIDKKSFVTMFIAVLDRNTNQVVCARAGHNPLIHYSAKTGETTSIKPDGIALGLRDTDNFSDSIREYQWALEDNDRLILYTDGITEAVDIQSEEFGEKRLTQTVIENHRKDSESMVNTIFAGVQSFAEGTEQFDDMTMIALRILPGKEV